MSKDKVVDLEMGSDGAYAPKAKTPPKNGHYKPNKVKGMSGADEFLGGLDGGLDFVEAIKMRVERLIKFGD